METMEYIGAICIGLWISYGIRLVRERIAIHRNEKRLARMQEITERIDRLCRNGMDYTSGAIDAFLSGDLETAKHFADASNEEADSIEELAKEYEEIAQKLSDTKLTKH